MDTNYYVHVNECTCCGRHDELHVGKSGCSVQGHVKLPWTDGEPTPIGEIRSWADWKRLLVEVPHTCWNEYGDRLTDEELIDIFERSSPEARRYTYDWVHRNDPRLLHAPDGTWLDADGYTVSGHGFS